MTRLPVSSRTRSSSEEWWSNDSADLGAVGQVGRDVIGGQLDLAVLHVLGMDEQNLVEEPELLEQGGADEAVEVAASDESEGAVR